jgi:hypothetical protein
VIEDITLVNMEPYNFKDLTVWFLDFSIKTSVPFSDNVGMATRYGNILKNLPLETSSHLLTYTISRTDINIHILNKLNGTIDNIGVISMDESIYNFPEKHCVLKVPCQFMSPVNKILSSILNNILMLKELHK